MRGRLDRLSVNRFSCSQTASLRCMPILPNYTLFKLPTRTQLACGLFLSLGDCNMIKAILKTMFGLVVLFVCLLALVNPYIFLAVIAITVAYWIGKSMLG